MSDVLSYVCIMSCILLSFLIPMFKTVSTHICANQNYPIKVLSANYLQKEHS